MNSGAASILDADRWLRLKVHFAQLAELAADARAAAFLRLDLADEDRMLLGQLLAQLDPDDARLATPISQPAPAPGGLRWQVGMRVGDYLIDGFLGRGGMSEVYAAHAIAGGDQVALKVLRQEMGQGERASFSENERRALQRLDDPLIARFIDSFVVPEIGLCLVLERVDGEALDVWCDEHQTSIDERLGLYLQICQAVASAHQQLVVHRDLKPGNVLVGADGRIKLLDFGVAKLLEDASTPTQTHGGLYTLEFAAPEQVLGNPVSTATDVYALGALLYRLLTRASPYAVANHESLVKAVLSDRPRRLAQGRAAGSALDRDLDLVIRRAMEKDPRDRYPSVSELMADVQSVRAGLPIRAGGGRGYRFAKFVRRHPAGIAMSAALLLALVAATGVSLYWAQQAQAQAQQAAVDARRASAANRFLLAVLDLNDNFSRRNSGDLSLAQVLDRAVQLAATELADEPEVRADVLSKLSVALQRRGETARALALANEAVATLEGLPQRDAEAYAAALRRVGSIEVDLNQLDAAKAHLLKSQHIVDGLTVDHRNTTISISTSLARIANAQGDPQAALRLYESIVPIRSSLDGDQRADAAMDQNNLGAAHLYLSHFAEAAQAYERAIKLLQDSLGEQHPRLGLVRSGYAVVLIQLGRFDAARAQLQQVRKLLGADGSEHNPHQAIAGLNAASIDYWEGDYAAAERALDANQPDLPPTHLVNAALWRGRVARAHGDSGAALEQFNAAEAGYLKAGGAVHARRWLAHGLAAISAGEIAAARFDGAALAAAHAALAAAPNSTSAERAELLLHSGAAARRRGDLALAVQEHRQCQQILSENGWLGDLGQAWIEGELSLDRLAQGASIEERPALIAQLERSIQALARLSPCSVQLREFQAALLVWNPAITLNPFRAFRPECCVARRRHSAAMPCGSGPQLVAGVQADARHAARAAGFHSPRALPRTEMHRKSLQLNCGTPRQRPDAFPDIPHGGSG